MKTLRSRFVLLFAFLITASLLLDCSDHSFKNVLDKFEDVSAVARGDVKEYYFFKGIVKNESPSTAIPTQRFLVGNEQKPQPSFSFTCKRKSYLHLLQLF